MSTISNETDTNVNDIWGVPVFSVKLAESFDEVVALNPEIRIEKTSSGEIVLMAPTGGESGFRNAKIGFQLQRWVESFGGLAFDSSTLFSLPSGAMRSPDASWVSNERWNLLSAKDRKRYPPLCPDFVIELRSETDRLVDLKAKMQEYMDNGARLGWLIDPLLKQIHIYRAGHQPEIQTSQESTAADDTLPGFVLDLQPIWADV